MKINIRKKVFETNSSSMHSLAVIGADRMGQSNFYTTEDEDGIEKITAESGEYGWGYDTLRTPMKKLSYVTTMIQYKDNDEIPDSKYFKWLSEMVKDYTGYELKYIPCNPNSEWSKDGYIDHQSDDTLDDVWSSNEEEFKNNMRDVIFNDKYFVVIDNDNH